MASKKKFAANRRRGAARCARPLLEQLKRWMEQSLRSLSTKSETAGAIRYALSRWKALTRYLDDGLLEIDDSAAERALRAVALGRKIISSVGLTRAATGPLPSTRWSAQPSSTDWIQNSIFARF
jgi:Transposase IS66 family